MKKKILFGLAFLSLASYLLCACGKDTPLLAVSDYELDTETSATARGVKAGDSYETFLSAYGAFDIFATAENSLVPSYEFQTLSEVPADQLFFTIIPTFFVDGQPIDPGQFCADNEIEAADLLSYLTAESYLADHKVIYRYLVFTWKDGVISDIRTESMDYNQDGSYYEAN